MFSLCKSVSRTFWSSETDRSPFWKNWKKRKCKKKGKGRPQTESRAWPPRGTTGNTIGAQFGFNDNPIFPILPNSGSLSSSFFSVHLFCLTSLYIHVQKPTVFECLHKGCRAKWGINGVGQRRTEDLQCKCRTAGLDSGHGRKITQTDHGETPRDTLKWGVYSFSTPSFLLQRLNAPTPLFLYNVLQRCN